MIMIVTDTMKAIIEVITSCTKGNLTPVYGKIKGEVAAATNTTATIRIVYRRFCIGVVVGELASPCFFARRCNRNTYQPPIAPKIINTNSVQSGNPSGL